MGRKARLLFFLAVSPRFRTVPDTKQTPSAPTTECPRGWADATLPDLSRHGSGGSGSPSTAAGWEALLEGEISRTFRALLRARTLSYPGEGVTQIISHPNPTTLAGLDPTSVPQLSRQPKKRVSVLFYK